MAYQECSLQQKGVPQAKFRVTINCKNSSPRRRVCLLLSEGQVGPSYPILAVYCTVAGSTRVIESFGRELLEGTATSKAARLSNWLVAAAQKLCEDYLSPRDAGLEADTGYGEGW